MNFRVAVCDDSERDREYIKRLTEAWAEKSGNMVKISLFDSAESFLFLYEENKDCDILLLDIEMGSINGVKLAMQVRKENKICQIIFITGYSDYIAEGYEVAALHYLMKPVREEKFFSVLDRAAEKLEKDDKVLTIEMHDYIARVPVYEIRWAEVMGNTVTIHAKEDHSARMSLGELERQLDERFYRVGRAVLVNLYFISRVTRSEIKLSDGTAIPLPRGAYDGVNRAIINMR